MTFPPGKWSRLLIGDQWPDDQDIQILSHGRTNRGAVEIAFKMFGEDLRRARTGALTEQRGHTIDDLRSAFRNGERRASAVGEKNLIKQTAYGAAYESMLSLQHDLTALAEEGNLQIQGIERSKDPAEAKATAIVALILRYQATARVVAAKYTGNVIDAIQRVLDVDGGKVRARQFARSQGVDVGQMFERPSNDRELSKRVLGMLGKTDTSEVLTTGKLPTAMPAPGAGASQHSEPELQSVGALPVSIQPGAASRPPTAARSSPEVLETGQAPTGHVYRGSMAGLSAALPPASVTAAPSAPAMPVSPIGSPMSSIVGGRTVLPEAAVAPSPPTPTISPTELAQSFNKGMESGAPFSAAAHATPSVPITSTEPQISHAAQTIPSAVASSQVHVPVVDSPPPVHHAPAAEVPPTPIVAAPQQISPPVTPQAVGPLPTYGSDLRPPVTTSITPPPPSAPLPPSATPSSAPVTPSAGQSPTNQPAVVRQTTPASTPPPPSAHGTQAVAATATGAAIGTASADATARKRLQRLVNAVARQQPRLAWAAGDRADKTTLLVTDLASGWIPPGIDLPSAVTLLPPARRRGNLEALLGDATVTASYTPVHLLPDDLEPNPTSSRPRSVPDVTDLGWELSQATQWRDGLPRLVHTLAKATSAGTGVLDSEIDLLREHLATTSKCVLDSYPDHVDAHQVGNWQLLAAIDALVGGDKATANYHLAWFLQAQI